MRGLNINCTLTDSAYSLNLKTLICTAFLQVKAQIKMLLEYLNMTTSPILFNRYLYIYTYIHIHSLATFF